MECKCCGRHVDPLNMATIEVKLEIHGRPVVLSSMVCSGMCSSEWLAGLATKIRESAEEKIAAAAARARNARN